MLFPSIQTLHGLYRAKTKPEPHRSIHNAPSDTDTQTLCVRELHYGIEIFHNPERMEFFFQLQDSVIGTQ